MNNFASDATAQSPQDPFASHFFGDDNAGTTPHDVIGNLFKNLISQIDSPWKVIGAAVAALLVTKILDHIQNKELTKTLAASQLSDIGTKEQIDQAMKARMEEANLHGVPNVDEPVMAGKAERFEKEEPVIAGKAERFEEKEPVVKQQGMAFA